MTETMRIQQGYKYRIYPTKAQEMKLRQVLGTKRFVYNHFLAKRQQHYEETGQGMSYKSLFDYSNNALYMLCVGANLCVRPFGSAQRRSPTDNYTGLHI
jgi:transposase